MKNREKLNYHVSKYIKNSEAIHFLNYQLDKEPYDLFRYVSYKDKSYHITSQGNEIIYKSSEEQEHDKTVTILTWKDGKKREITLQIREYGNEISIIDNDLAGNVEIFQLRQLWKKTKITRLTFENYQTKKEKCTKKKTIVLNEFGIPIQEQAQKQKNSRR